MKQALTSCVILAAGMGSRLRPLTLDRPKAMVELCGRPLLEYVLNFAAALTSGGPCYVVGGYRMDRLEQYRCSAPLSYELVENINYHGGGLLSLVRALPILRESFYLLNADHVFGGDAAAAVMKVGQEQQIAICCDAWRQLGPDDMKVATRVNRGVREVDAISKQLRAFHLGYVGITHVPSASLARYRAACDQVLSLYGNDSSPEAVIGHMAEQGDSILCHDIGEHRWHEIDTLSDHEAAARALRSEAGHL